MNPILQVNRKAEGAIGARLFVKEGAADFGALQASAATDRLVGVSNELVTATASGERVDLTILGIAELVLGGTVARRDPLTSDANGKGVKATAPGQYIGAYAMQSGVAGDIIDVLVVCQRASADAGVPAGATITVGDEATNVVAVAIQLTDADGNDMAVASSVLAYLSDDDDGSSLIATAPDGGVAIGTDGLWLPTVANKQGHFISEADGDIDIEITETGTKTCYLVLVMPNGRLVISDAITHAA